MIGSSRTACNFLIGNSFLEVEMTLTSAKLLTIQLLIAPLPLLAYVNLERLGRGRGVEPFADNLLGYVLLLIVFGAAAVALSAYHSRRGPKRSLISDILIYSLVAAMGSALLLLLLDYLDNYFSGPGIGWILPASGAALGAAFGAIFRVVFKWFGPREMGR
jgi:hypothetical protein